jgi:hypothetical protein
LPSASAINFAVHGHKAVHDGLFHVSTGVEESSKFQELPEANDVTSDRDIVDRSPIRHPGILVDQVPAPSVLRSRNMRSVTSLRSNLRSGHRLRSGMLKRTCYAQWRHRHVDDRAEGINLDLKGGGTLRAARRGLRAFYRRTRRASAFAPMLAFPHVRRCARASVPRVRAAARRGWPCALVPLERRCTRWKRALVHRGPCCGRRRCGGPSAARSDVSGLTPLGTTPAQLRIEESG